MVVWVLRVLSGALLQVNQAVIHLSHDSFYCSALVQLWGVRGIAQDNRCERLFPLCLSGGAAYGSSPVTHCCGIICLEIKCVPRRVWGRIYQCEFFLWSIRASYFADGFWNLAKPQYAVKIAVLGFLGTWAHLHLILRPLLLSDVFEASVLGSWGWGASSNSACLSPSQCPIQTCFRWLPKWTPTPTWIRISLSSKVQAGSKLLFSIYMNFSVPHISCCPAPPNRMVMLKAPYYSNASLHFELETKVINTRKASVMPL